MQKMDLVFDDVCMSAIRHEGLWRIATDWLWKGVDKDWVPPLEISLTDAKMGALLALMMDGDDNQEFLDEAIALLTPEEIGKFSEAELIP